MSVPEASISIFATTTKICTGAVSPRLAPEAASRPPRPPTRRGRPLAPTAEYRCDAFSGLVASAGELFRLPWPPSCCSNQHLLWGLMSVDLGALTPRSIHPASPVLLTKNSPLGTRIPSPASFGQVGHLTNLKFENRLRSF